MSMRGWVFSVVAIALVPAAQAQRPAAVETGYVTGKVLSADTNRPARLASVVLVPVVDPVPVKSEAWPGAEPITKLSQTSLDGSFTVQKVQPGRYYVVAEKVGYLSPLALFSREQISHPDAASAALMAHYLTPVTVVANHGSAAEVRIYRGAVISGNIRFDDGTPMSNTRVSLDVRDKKGVWVPLRLAGMADESRNASDDRGAYRISGLPAGEYQVRTQLQLEDTYSNHIFSNGGSTSRNTRYELTVFFGDTFRRRDAKTVKLEDGEESGGTDISVRLAQLHSVAGIVTEGNGQVVNAARLSLHYTDDDEQVTTTEVRGDDNAFRFDFVPEGEYTLRVSDARVVAREEVSNGENTVPPFRIVEKTLRSFGTQAQAVVIQNDIQNLIVIVPAKAAAAPASSK